MQVKNSHFEINVSDILNRFMKLNGIDSINEISRILDLKPSTITNWKKRNSHTALFDIVSKCEKTVNLNWLVFGEGEMYLDQTTFSKVEEEHQFYGNSDEAWREAVKSKNELIEQLKKRIEELEADQAKSREQMAS